MSAIIGPAQAKPSDKSAYDFSFEALNGRPLPLSAYKGKVLLLVNTASKCGFTPQYKGLQALYDRYKDRGLVIIGVPSNDFGAQEPGNAQEIKQFCELNYGVTFPMTAKQVVSGNEAHPFYQWAHEVLGFSSTPKWNFHKYLIDKNGALVTYFGSATPSDSEKLVAAIEKLL
ncbi:MAG: glutathione peroxidase [Rickettsiales bacterium]|nr:glutathione peroxidase [Rickettsiales bacterium]